MNITRTAIRTARPLWSSANTQNMNIWFRSITTGKDHVQLGLFGSKLDKFLGRWLETESHNMRRYLLAGGVPQSRIDRYENRTSWRSYSRKDDYWTCTYGYLDTDFEQSYLFRLGGTFYTEFVDGRIAKIVVTKEEGSLLKEDLETTEQPITRAVILRKVKGKEMTVVKQIDDVVAKRKYMKVA